MSSSFLLKAVNICKTYGDRVIFKIGRVELYRGERIGLVGSNGAGKSTLLSALMGEIDLDDGSIDTRGFASMIRQEQDPDSLRSSDVLEDAGRGRESFLATTLSARPSGGELTRAAIAEALARKPDIIFADEPTTNLDMEGIDRLRRLLVSFNGALVLVSHDRGLLDDVCNEIWELENGSLRVFPGNYSEWLVQRQRERDLASSEYDEFRRERRRLMDAARRVSDRAGRAGRPPSRMSRSEARVNPGKGLRAQGALKATAGVISKRAETLEKKERPLDLPEIKMALGVSSRIASDFAIRASGLTVAFDGRTILNDVSFEVRTAKRTILLGPNGSGKTTLFDMIAQGRPPIRIAPGARIGYFSQRHESLNLSRSILEDVRSGSDLPEDEIRTILARLGIKGGDVHKRCGNLSGGERAKVVFASLFASNLNTLILDEPTNHIDLYTTEALEALLLAWKGTLVLASHDMRLAGSVGDRLLIINGGKIRTFEGPLAEYE
ncbi:MAG: ATP-binding cassette domain-containing protein [Synergistaceae bacterium]|jgi:ATPase subunit of ABC transporter with duplicated ATPase domains|nr:ATP-binding cassette domain-containing protein [Synergistaceae bacterium]